MKNVWLGCCVVIVAGCSTLAGRLELLKNRAAFDMDCPKEQLQLTDLGGQNTYGVSGCGKRATYVGNNCRGSAAKSYCQWLLNTDDKASAGGEAPVSDIGGAPPSDNTTSAP